MKAMASPDAQNTSSKKTNTMKSSLTPDPSEFRTVPLPRRICHSTAGSINNATPTLTSFCSNLVITSKYTVWNFLPKFLLESFRKLANVYFLFVACLQCVPWVSDTGNLPTTLPVLLFILTVDGVLAILQDLRRHRADNEANAAICQVVSLDGPADPPPAEEGNLTSVSWAQLTVGNVVKLRNHETAPADLLILAVHEPDPDNANGVCYVETKSLDGETNLKQRHAVPVTLNAQTADQILKIGGFLRCEQPNRIIGRFDGTLCIGNLEESCSLTSSTTQQQVTPGRLEAVSIQNMILRGCQLRNTLWVYGLVVNTGYDTKIMQSASISRAKWSSINKIVNQMIKWLLFLLVLFCATAASCEVVWIHRHQQASKFLGLDETSMVVLWFEDVGSYFLLLYQMIPVSLYVTMSMVMLFQSMFMGMDLDMYDPKHDSCAIVKSLELNEELGQVSHVFSDKTGTLTCNVMEFRKCSINGRIYGRGTTQIGRAVLQRKGIAAPLEEETPSCHDVGNSNGDSAEGVKEFEERIVNVSNAPLPVKRSPSKVLCATHCKVPFVNFDDTRLDPMIARLPLRQNSLKSQSEAKDLEATTKLSRISLTREAEFFLLLSLCHTVIPERTATDELHYSASSPDEQALVSAARFFGFCFESRTLGKVKIRVTNKKCLQDATRDFEIWEFEILEVLEFTSDRKRMSVIVAFPDETKWILTKGAESAIFPLLAAYQIPNADTPSPSDARKDFLTETMEHLMGFAEEGLRTLTIACRELTPNEFENWSVRYDQAFANLEEIEKKRNGLPNEIDQLISQIENDLSLLGVTAIEDKLQTNVPRTIMKLLRAGMKVWMLTGDQQVTAINISYACQLLTDSMHQLIFNLELFPNADRIHEAILNVKAKLSIQSQQKALIIDGECLEVVLSIENAQFRRDFFELVNSCCAVICCRVTPSQKAEIVGLVREFIPEATTLAIGDGANDVAMIQRAHVGVGILASQEGMQAVNASDYAICEFCFLEKLLLHHGRLIYKRMACLVGYMFYKNILMVLVEFLYMFFTGSSASKFYCEGFFQLYNVFYTSMPILYLGTFDCDIKWQVAQQHPELYLVGVHKQLFSARQFFSKWILSACLEAFGIVLVTLAGYSDGSASRASRSASATREEYGLLAFTLVVMVVNCKLWMVQMSWTKLASALWIATIMGFLPLSTAMTSNLEAFFPNEYGSFEHVVRAIAFWLVIMLGVVGILLRDYVVLAFQRRFAPRPWQIIQEIPLAKRTSTIAVGEANSTRLQSTPAQVTSPMASDLGVASFFSSLAPSRRTTAIATAPTVPPAICRTGSGPTSSALANCKRLGSDEDPQQNIKEEEECEPQAANQIQTAPPAALTDSQRAGMTSLHFSHVQLPQVKTFGPGTQPEARTTVLASATASLHTAAIAAASAAAHAASSAIHHSSGSKQPPRAGPKTPSGFAFSYDSQSTGIFPSHFTSRRSAQSVGRSIGRMSNGRDSAGRSYQSFGRKESDI